MDELILNIRSHWPKYPVTNQNLINPTEEFVTKFYVEFIKEMNENVTKLTDVGSNSLEQHLSPIEIYRKMNKIIPSICLNKQKFTIYDELQPTAKRTQSFIMICMHFLKYCSHLLLSPTGNAFQDVMEKKRGILEIKFQIKELLENITENSHKLGNLQVWRGELETQFKIEKEKHSNMQDQIPIEENERKQREQTIERLQVECNHLDYKLQQLYNKHQKTQEEVVSVDEYNHIQSCLSNLKKEEDDLRKSFENEHSKVENEQEVLERFDKCISLLSNLSFDSHVCEDLIKNEKELISWQTIKKQIETNLLEAKNIQEKLLQDIKDLSKQYSDKIATCSEKCANMEQILNKLAGDYSTALDNYKLKKISQEEYKVELKKAVDKYVVGLEGLKKLQKEIYSDLHVSQQDLLNKFIRKI